MKSSRQRAEWLTRNRPTILLLLVILFFCSYLLNPPEAAAAFRDMVIVIDRSTSMLDEFDEVKAVAKDFTASAQMGDRVTVITFGSSTYLLERRHIKSAGDLTAILAAIEGVEPTDVATSLGAGMERSLDELRRLYNENESNERVILWLSDDKNNPPPDMNNVITFASLKEKQAQHLPDKEWFAFKSPIRHEQSDVEWFVHWANRKDIPLKVSLSGGDSEEIYPPVLEREVKVQFEPETPAAQGSSFLIIAEVADMEGTARFVPAPVEPRKITCLEAPWEETLRIEFPSQPGKYLCKISFVSPSDQTLKISPLQVNVKGTVLAPIQTVKQPPDVPAASLADVRESGGAQPEPNGSSRDTRPRVAELSQANVSAGESFLKYYITQGMDELSLITEVYLAPAAKFLSIFLGLLLLSFGVKRFIFGGAGLSGQLETLECPTEEKMKPIRLRQIGRLKGRSFLTIGSDKKADIILHDKSVAALHARVSAARTPAGNLVFLQPLSNHPILVNGVPCLRAKELGNGDIITMGVFKFSYRCHQSFKEILLCFRDGRSIRGMLVSWDIESPLFQFLPKGAPSLEASMTVEFSELKWLNFIASRKRMGSRFRKDNTPTGRPAEIIFKDGDVMEGYAIGDWSESSDRFYLVPRNQSDHTLYMVEKAAVQNVFFRENEKPQRNGELH